MSQLDDFSYEDSSNESQEPFPIPRLSQITNPRPAIIPSYKPDIEQFNPDLFQLFYSLVNFNLPSYDLDNNSNNNNQQFSAALENVGTAFEEQQSSPVLKEHIVRSFLIECQSQLMLLSSKPVLSKFEKLHHELFLTSEILHLHKVSDKLIDFCEMLMADTYDLFNSYFASIVKNQYWDQGKTATDLINELLKKEIGAIRLLNNQSFSVLSKCAITRSIENAGEANSNEIITWANQNEIPFQSKTK